MRTILVKFVKVAFIAQLIISGVALLLYLIFELGRLIGIIFSSGASMAGGLASFGKHDWKSGANQTYGLTPNLMSMSILESISLLFTALTIVAVIVFLGTMFVGGVKGMAMAVMKGPLKGGGLNNFMGKPLGGTAFKGLSQGGRILSRLPGRGRMFRGLRRVGRGAASTGDMANSVLSIMGDRDKTPKTKGKIGTALSAGAAKAGKFKKPASDKLISAKNWAADGIRNKFDSAKASKVGKVLGRIGNSKAGEAAGWLASMATPGLNDYKVGVTAGKTGLAFGSAIGGKVGSLINSATTTAGQLAEALVGPISDDSEIGARVDPSVREAKEREEAGTLGRMAANAAGMNKSDETSPSRRPMSEGMAGNIALPPTERPDTPDNSIRSAAVASAAGAVIMGGLNSKDVGKGTVVSDLSEIKEDTFLHKKEGEDGYTMYTRNSVGGLDVVSRNVDPSSYGQTQTDMPSVVGTNETISGMQLGRYMPATGAVDGSGNSYTLVGNDLVDGNGLPPQPNAVLTAGNATLMPSASGTGYTVMSGQLESNMMDDNKPGLESLPVFVSPQALETSPFGPPAVDTRPQPIIADAVSGTQTTQPIGVHSQGGAVDARPITGDYEAAVDNMADNMAAGMSPGIVGGLLSSAMLAGLGNRDNSIHLSDTSIEGIAGIVDRAYKDSHSSPGFNANDKSTWSDNLSSLVQSEVSRQTKSVGKDISDPATSMSVQRDMSNIIEDALKAVMQQTLSAADDDYASSMLTGGGSDIDRKTLARILRNEK